MNIDLPVAAISDALGVLAAGYVAGSRLLPGRPAAQVLVYADAPQRNAAAEILYRPALRWQSIPKERHVTRWIGWYTRMADRYVARALETYPVVSVNASSAQLANDRIYALLRRLPSPKRVVIEWVESRCDDATFRLAGERLRELRDREGFMVALDDAGTGQDTLQRLRQVRPKWVKIDGGLFQSGAMFPGSAADHACRSLAKLSADLGAEPVAEWVENAIQLDYAVAIGCRLLQGFLVGAPRPI